MLSAIIEDTVTKRDEYLYLKKENNKLIYYGFSIQNSDVKPIDKDIINKIYNLLRINETCVYIEDYLDYKVYLDKINNIKHYLKNGVEDFMMLFENNGENLILYNSSDNKDNSDCKKFKINNTYLKLTKKIILAISSAAIIGSLLRAAIFPAEFTSENIDIIYSISEFFNLDINSINEEEAIELINSSDLPISTKQALNNKNLLDDIFPYYGNTKMECLIKTKLQNLQLNYYDINYYKYHFWVKDNTTGFYNEFTPNILYIREDIDNDQIAKHEFIHLLQFPSHEYPFLREASAEIVAYEYLEKPYSSYSYAIDNVSLLMDVIGPKVVWETVFGGNDTNLKNVLKNNLSENDYNELMFYLNHRPLETKENNKRINEIIANLYKNINLNDIKNDNNIYDVEGNHIDKIYFNEDMMEYNGLRFQSLYGVKEAIYLGLITPPVYEEIYLKEITKEEYIEYQKQLQNNPEYKKLQDEYKIVNRKEGPELSEFLRRYKEKIEEMNFILEDYFPLRDDVKIEYYTKDNFYSVFYQDITKEGEIILRSVNISEALEMKLISAKYYQLINGKNLTEAEKKKYKLYHSILSECHINNDNALILLDMYGKLVNVQVTYRGSSIKEIFPDQTVRSINNDITK